MNNISLLTHRVDFLHHTIGWTMIVGSVFPIAQAFRPRSLAAATGFASVYVVTAIMLFCDRDSAAIFGHFSQYAGVAHR